MGNNYKKKNKNKKKRLERAKNAANENPEEQVQVEDQGNESDGENEGNFSSSKKRQHEVEDDSDVEEKPQRKKKKKPLQMDSTDKKGKKSIRQMKREKFAARQAEAQSASKDQLKSQCLNYLSQWKHDKQNWKFMKARQVWLFKNKFSTHLVPDASWPTLLEYFESAQGNIRNILLEDANKVIKQMDEWTESQNRDTKNDDEDEDEENEDSEETPKIKKPDDSVYKRARDLIQCLEE